MKNQLVNRISKTCTGAVVLVLLALGANAASRISLQEQPYAPLWAWPLWTLSDADPDVVVWVFYRAPENVPSDFNLLEGFDWNDRDANGIPDPWDYPLLGRGFEIFKDPTPFSPPSKILLREIDEVPIWFTAREETLQVLSETGTITIEQLTQMASLVKGAATFYHEENHLALGAKEQIVKENSLAKGMLEDGRSFSVQTVVNLNGERENYVFKVEFK